jgi:hypothetical protein
MNSGAPVHSSLSSFMFLPFLDVEAALERAAPERRHTPALIPELAPPDVDSRRVNQFSQVSTIPDT